MHESVKALLAIAALFIGTVIVGSVGGLIINPNQANLERVEATANNAMSEARAAQQTASNAQAAAGEASLIAAEAQRTASESQRCCSENTERLDRMFSKPRLKSQ